MPAGLFGSKWSNCLFRKLWGLREWSQVLQRLWQCVREKLHEVLLSGSCHSSAVLYGGLFSSTFLQWRLSVQRELPKWGLHKWVRGAGTLEAIFMGSQKQWFDRIEQFFMFEFFGKLWIFCHWIDMLRKLCWSNHFGKFIVPTKRLWWNAM